MLKDRTGQVLSGRYRIDDLIGVGGLAQVYSAEPLGSGSRVAIKFINGSTAPEEVRERFRREAHALALLRHSSVVSVIDFGEEDGELFLVMELVVGPTLTDCIFVNDQPMTFPRIVGVARQLLDVLEAAHRAHVIHRDLKPDNVMLAQMGDRPDHVKVLDFGLALILENPDVPRLTLNQMLQGTPHYMSPEQCRGRDVGPPTDVYSVGVILYEMLCGEPPFDAISPEELMAAHLYTGPPPIRTRGVGRDVPEVLEEVTMRALSKNAETRPTAGEMRDALDAYSGAGS